MNLPEWYVQLQLLLLKGGFIKNLNYFNPGTYVKSQGPDIFRVTKNKFYCDDSSVKVVMEVESLLLDTEPFPVEIEQDKLHWFRKATVKDVAEYLVDPNLELREKATEIYQRLIS